MDIYYRSTILLSLILFTALATAAPLSEPAESCPKTCHCADMNMQYALGLSATQQHLIMQIRSEYQPQLQSNKQALSVIEKQIRAISQTPKMDQASLDLLIRKQEELVGQRIKTKTILHHKLYNVLTPEQKLRFNHMEQDWSETE